MTSFPITISFPKTEMLKIQPAPYYVMLRPCQWKNHALTLWKRGCVKTKVGWRKIVNENKRKRDLTTNVASSYRTNEHESFENRLLFLRCQIQNPLYKAELQGLIAYSFNMMNISEGAWSAEPVRCPRGVRRRSRSIKHLSMKFCKRSRYLFLK